MKEFNLEQAKAGKPVCTRDGRKVRIVCWDVKDDRFPILALVDDGKFEQEQSYTNDGHYVEDEEMNLDLMMASKKHEGWITVISGLPHHWYRIYETEQQAKEAEDIPYNHCERVATIHIEWEE